MAEPSTDDRIARLVHLVLEAVDQRLADIRAELHVLTQRLGDVENRLADAAPRSASRRNTDPPAPDQRIEQLAAEVRLIRVQVETLATRPAPSARSEDKPTNAPAAAVEASVPSLPSLTSLTAHPQPTHASVPSAQEAAARPAGDSNELIDLDRLGDLLSERLGHLNLPRPS